MSLDKKDIEDVRLSRPVSVTDLWDLDDRVDRLEDVVNRVERVVEVLIELYRSERVKNWEMILKEMVNQEMKKEEKEKRNPKYGNRVR